MTKPAEIKVSLTPRIKTRKPRKIKDANAVVYAAETHRRVLVHGSFWQDCNPIRTTSLLFDDAIDADEWLSRNIACFVVEKRRDIAIYPQEFGPFLFPIIRPMLENAALKLDTAIEKRAYINGRGHNCYALSLYLDAVSNICDDILAGSKVRDAICMRTNDRLRSAFLKALKLKPLTIREAADYDVLQAAALHSELGL